MELMMSALICKIENEAYFINLSFLIWNNAHVICHICQRHHEEYNKEYIIPTILLVLGE
jgi:hypothetical protein